MGFYLWIALLFIGKIMGPTMFDLYGSHKDGTHLFEITPNHYSNLTSDGRDQPISLHQGGVHVLTDRTGLLMCLKKCEHKQIFDICGRLASYHASWPS